MKDFCCPKCGSSFFGSGKNRDGSWTGHCHGQVLGSTGKAIVMYGMSFEAAQKLMQDCMEGKESIKPCDFSWNRNDDSLCFTKARPAFPFEEEINDSPMSSRG